MVEGGISGSMLTTKNNWLASPMFDEDAKIQGDSCGAPVTKVENKECFKFKRSQSNKSSPVNVAVTPQKDNTG